VMEDQYYIVDLRKEFSGQKYVTFWGPANCGYKWPLPWAGKYTLGNIEVDPAYYSKPDGSRFPVLCSVVDALAVNPDPGDIDNDTGPVLRMTPSIRRLLRRNRLRHVVAG